MFSFQGVASLAVIKSGRRRRPLHDREVFAVVLGVAAGTVLAGARSEAIRGVQSTMAVETGGDFSVALQAPEDSPTAELVATGAMDRAVQRLVCARQWPRRDLPTGVCRKQKGNRPQPHNNAEDLAKRVNIEADLGPRIRSL